ncbi:MAG: winged helix-turn-helix transcriptional regulator [bacterium]
MTPEEQRTLDLFEAVESRPGINQRQLAEELGISLGLANAFLKTILNKGWIRARKVKARRWFYFLTPQGSLEKSRLTLNYLQRTLKSFRDLRNKADQLLADLNKNGIEGIHLIGEEDFIDIIGLCLEHHQMQCLSKIIKPRIDAEEDYSEWLPDQFPELKTSERFLVALLLEKEEVLQKLLSNGYQDQKHWVSMI